MGSKSPSNRKRPTESVDGELGEHAGGGDAARESSVARPAAWGRPAKLTEAFIELAASRIARGCHPLRALMAEGMPRHNAKRVLGGNTADGLGGKCRAAAAHAWACAVGDAEMRTWEKRPDIWLKSGPAKGRGRGGWTEAARLANRPAAAPAAGTTVNVVQLDASRLLQLVEQVALTSPEAADKLRLAIADHLAPQE